MANVPYSPVPNVAPTVPGLPRVGIDTPPAAFGLATAAATQRLGQQTEQSSNEMFQTALGVQQLRNDTWAKDNFVQKSGLIGDAEQDFRKLRGADAAAAYPTFKQRVTQIYQDAIANAPNPQAGRMLADSLSRRITYSIEDGGRHAGEQELQSMKTTQDNVIAGSASTAAQYPNNDKAFNDSLAQGQQAARTRGRLEGESEADYSKRVEAATAIITKARLDTIAQTNPALALQMLDANQALPDVNGKPNPAKVIGVSPNGEPFAVEMRRAYLQGSAYAQADTIISKMKPDSGEDFRLQAIQEAKAAGAPYGPVYTEHLVAQVEARFTQLNTAYRAQESGAFARLATEITGADGSPPITDRNDFLNNPIRYQMFESLSQSARGKLMQDRLLNMVDAQGKKGTLGEIAQQQLVNELLGLGVEAEQDPTKLEEFVNRSSEAFPQLDQGRRSQLATEQLRIMRNAQKPEADPTHLAMVMRTLDPILLAHNIDRQAPDAAGQSRYLQFQGQVYQKLQEMTARGEQIPSNPVKLQELFAPMIPSTSLSSSVRATPAPQSTLPTITTKAAYDALAPGASFKGADGKTYTKPNVQPATQPGG